jgi:hypothetical protein
MVDKAMETKNEDSSVPMLVPSYLGIKATSGVVVIRMPTILIICNSFAKGTTNIMEDKVIHITTIPIKQLMLMKAEDDGHFLDEGTVETNNLKDPDCFFVATHELEPAYYDEPPLLLKIHAN